MTYLRHASRHTKETVFRYLEAQLTALHWLDTDQSNRPFQAPLVIMKDTLPKESDARAKLQPGYMSLVTGAEPAVLDQEVGGPLGMIPIPMFVDLLMDKPGNGYALACDVRDILSGAFTEGHRSIVVNDYTTNPDGVPNNDYVLEFDDIQMVPSAEVENWWIVHFVASLYFPQVIY
jgi:hypothetical protein